MVESGKFEIKGIMKACDSISRYEHLQAFILLLFHANQGHRLFISFSFHFRLFNKV